MTVRQNHYVFFTGLILLFTLTSKPAAANKLYQWTDKDGVITYSPTPPPETSGLTYDEVELETKPKAPDIAVRDAETENAISQTRSEHPVLPPATSIEKTPAGHAVKSMQANGGTTKTVSSNDDKCQDLANRVTALESRITLVNDANALNQTILLLSRYQERFDNDCVR